MKKPWLFRLYIGIILPNSMGIFISQYKDPYKPTSIMESKRGFFVAQLIPRLSAIFAYPSVNPKAPPVSTLQIRPRKKLPLRSTILPLNITHVSWRSKVRLMAGLPSLETRSSNLKIGQNTPRKESHLPTTMAFRGFSFMIVFGSRPHLDPTDLFFS